MRKSRRVLPLFVLALIPFHRISAWAQDVIIVTNKAVPTNRVTTAEIRDLFTGASTRLSDGTRVTPVVLKGGPAHEVFLKNYMGRNAEEFRTLWRKLVFTGQGSMPREFSSEAAMLQYVAVTPGAIGYASRVTDADDVKVLSVVTK